MNVLIFVLAIGLSNFTFSQSDCEQCVPEALNHTLPFLNPPEWPIEYIKVEKVNYERNEKSDYCKRPPEMIDTIVIHHSQTPSTEDALDMNDIHLNNGWYMIGYSYTINSPYPGERSPLPQVTEGRPIDIVGSHAGSKAFVPMTREQKKMWDDGKITCGFTGQEFKVDPEQFKDGKIKANITTIGMVIIGNYAPFSFRNPKGFSRSRPRYPSKDTLIMAAKMSCQLQKKYPNIKNIKWHSYFSPTLCPGTIKQSISEIIRLTKDYGCEFN